MVGTSDFALGLDVTVKGTDQVIRQIQNFVPEMRRPMEDAVRSAGERLRDRARAKAEGEVVQERSGRLVASIQFAMRSSETGVFGTVYSDDPSDPTFEFGATEQPRDILPNVKQALAFLGGSVSTRILSLGTAGAVYAAVVHRPVVEYPKRPIIHAAFDEMAEEIEHEIESASHKVLIDHAPDWLPDWAR